MSEELSLDYRLRWLDFDRFGHIHPLTVLDLFQDVASLQAENMGIGRATMLAKGVFWVVVRMKYEIVQQPQRFEVVSARTWPHTPTNFSFLRDFQLKDLNGNLCIRATSEWVLMDLETRKFARMLDYVSDAYDLVKERCFDAKPRKIKAFSEGNRPAKLIVPSNSDIDINGHVNNACYLRFVTDTLEPEDFADIHSLQIDYRHEVFPDAPICMHTLAEGDGIRVKGVLENGDTAFLCAIQ